MRGLGASPKATLGPTQPLRWPPPPCFPTFTRAYLHLPSVTLRYCAQVHRARQFVHATEQWVRECRAHSGQDQGLGQGCSGRVQGCAQGEAALTCAALGGVKVERLGQEYDPREDTCMEAFVRLVALDVAARDTPQ